MPTCTAPEMRALISQKEQFQKRIKKNELMASVSGGNPIYLYVLNRKGWMLEYPNAKAIPAQTLTQLKQVCRNAR